MSEADGKTEREKRIGEEGVERGKDIGVRMRSFLQKIKGVSIEEIVNEK